MIGDPVDPSAANVELVRELREFVLSLVHEKKARRVVAIAGESGSGKSVLAASLADALAKKGCVALVLQQDDYFFLPPRTNDRIRRKHFDHVGPGEVNLALLQQHIHAFKAGHNKLVKPLVIYPENRIVKEEVNLGSAQVLIVEGTYVLYLQAVDVGVFLDRDYRQTRQDRHRRGREAPDPFIERVLAKEHRLILPQRELATHIVDAHFRLQANSGSL